MGRNNLQKRAIDTISQDNWTSISNTFIPLSACKLIPDVSLSSEQLNGILRFEDETSLLEHRGGNSVVRQKSSHLMLIALSVA